MKSWRFFINNFGIVLAVLVMFALTAYAWTGPLTSPPTCNPGDPGCDAPVNVGVSNQIKLGSLGVAHLAAGGSLRSYFNHQLRIGGTGNTGIYGGSPDRSLLDVNDTARPLDYVAADDVWLKRGTVAPIGQWATQNSKVATNDIGFDFDAIVQACAVPVTITRATPGASGLAGINVKHVVIGSCWQDSNADGNPNPPYSSIETCTGLRVTAVGPEQFTVVTRDACPQVNHLESWLVIGDPL